MAKKEWSQCHCNKYDGSQDNRRAGASFRGLRLGEWSHEFFFFFIYAIVTTVLYSVRMYGSAIVRQSALPLYYCTKVIQCRVPS